jgi:NAD(P)-dependent dehydrogenase (short-subunit alcohol dehydrogenase family)
VTPGLLGKGSHEERDRRRVGPQFGLGATLCQRLAAQGYQIYLSGRTRVRLETVAESIRDQGGVATPVAAVTTNEADVIRLFDLATSSEAALECVIYNAGNNVSSPLRDLTAKTFEEAWLVSCFGGFLVGREVARRMVPNGRGTVIFTGASASLRGRPTFAAFAAAKAGLRAVTQSMAREFGPQGLHVAHVIIDGGINGEIFRTHGAERVQERGEDGLLDLNAIADAYMHLLTQSKTARTHEIDLRPYKEPF